MSPISLPNRGYRRKGKFEAKEVAYHMPITFNLLTFRSSFILYYPID